MSDDVRRSGRAHKEPTRLEVAAERPAAPKKIEIPQGKGVKLGDHPVVAHNINKAEEESLKTLHSLLIGTPGVARQRKSHIRSFNGWEGDSNDKHAAKLNGKTMDELKTIAQVLDLTHSGSKEEIVGRIVEFLANPQPSGRAVEKKRKRAAGEKPAKAGKVARKGKKAGKDGADKPKRTPTAFFLFSQERRPEVRAKNPEMKITEVAAALGAEWRALSDAAKKKYVDEAERLKAAAPAAAAKPKAAKKPAAAAAEPASDDGGDDDEDDDGEDDEDDDEDADDE